jgi:hypothetical protein
MHSFLSFLVQKVKMLSMHVPRIGLDPVWVRRRTHLFDEWCRRR